MQGILGAGMKMEVDRLSKITKAEIVDAIYNRTGANRKEIRDMVDYFIEEVKGALIARSVIELRGFGTFEVKIRKGRQKARNPRTGEILSVNSHGIVAFRPGRELKQEVWLLKNGQQDPQAESTGGEAAGLRSEPIQVSAAGSGVQPGGTVAGI